MKKIETITNDALQNQTLTLENGTRFTIVIYFVDLQKGWFINELTYGDFTLRGVRITNSPNFLHQFRNLIPFGLACFSKQNREPMLIDDFSSGNSAIYILNDSEITEYANYLNE